MARRIDCLFKMAFMYQRLTVVRANLLVQVKTIRWRGIEVGEAPQRRGNEIDLFDIGTAVNAGREMQTDQDFDQVGKTVVQILRGSISHIETRQAAMDPL